MSRETKEMIIWSACSVGSLIICLLWISTIPEGTPGLLNRNNMATITEATMTDVATATEPEPQTYYKRYGIEPQIEYESVNAEEYRYIPSPVLSERKEPKLEVEIVTTEEITTEEVVYEEPEVVYEEPAAPSGMTYIGTFYCTGYVATGNPCANGNYPSVGYTIASNSLPMGTTVYIDGLGNRVVEDTGGMPNSVIDVFVGSVDEAYAITGNYEVYVYE